MSRAVLAPLVGLALGVGAAVGGARIEGDVSTPDLGERPHEALTLDLAWAAPGPVLDEALSRPLFDPSRRAEVEAGALITLAPTLAPAQSSKPELRGIFIAGAARSALVALDGDARWVSVGDQMGGYRLTRVTEDLIELIGEDGPVVRRLSDRRK